MMANRLLSRVALQICAVALFATANSASAGLISTGFGGATACFGCGNFFDITTFGNAISIESLEINVGTGSVPVSVYAKAGSYDGFETTPAAWTLMSSNTVTGLGQGTPTLVDIANFVLAANSVTGIYVMQGPDTTVWYDSVASVFSNADLQLDLGKSDISPFTSTIYSPRSWNGTINYDVVPVPATFALFGIGLAGLGWSRRKKA